MLFQTLLLSFSAAASAGTCQDSLTHPDPHSFARPDQVAVTHAELDLTVDFSKQEISGSVRYRIRHHAGARQLHLDTRELRIDAVHALDGRGRPVPTRFTLSEPDAIRGRELAIEISPDTTGVEVRYGTLPGGNALQWLNPEQTAGGTAPFLYTKGSPDRARAWFPCQDTPGVRMTYNATVRVPPDLLPLMSAANPKRRNRAGVYRFEMPQPIPSYLVSLAVGNLRFRKISGRVGVYAEPGVVKNAAWEFADADRIMSAAESLFGRYLWGRWDMLIMPPSYPIMGMENPRLNYFSPTLITGERSTLSVVAHEQGHSWSGNKVTNATWNEVWLNEGVTSYAEYRIIEAVYGTEYADTLARLKIDALLEELKTKAPEDTALYLNLSGRDPYDGFSPVAYVKGFWFLRTTEQAVGRERFDAFLREYFDAHAFQSITTKEFLAFLRNRLVRGDAELESRLKIDEWVYGPGIPAGALEVGSGVLARAEAAAAGWAGGSPASSIEASGDVSGWSQQSWVHFLRKLPQNVGPDRMAELDTTFGFSKRGNAAVAMEWFKQVIANRYEPAYPALEEYLVRVGAGGYLRPLYTELAKTPEGLERARRIYARAKPGYHSQVVKLVEGILR